MTVIRSMDTDYAGYRFRSRLEARWAVFFDDCNIDWEYEPQSFSALDIYSGRRRGYLPDFRLDNGQWAEVKGILDVDGFKKLWLFASDLTRCGLRNSNDLVVFGNIPRVHSLAWPSQLHYCRKGRKGDNVNRLWAVPWSMAREDNCPMNRSHVEVPDPHSLSDREAREMADRFVIGFPWGTPFGFEGSLERARKARFEWGESG
jgi:hypothetical protein